MRSCSAPRRLESSRAAEAAVGANSAVHHQHGSLMASGCTVTVLGSTSSISRPIRKLPHCSGGRPETEQTVARICLRSSGGDVSHKPAPLARPS